MPGVGTHSTGHVADLRRRQRARSLRRVRQNSYLIWGVTITLVLALAVLFGPIAYGKDPLGIDVTNRLQAPSFHNWLGTDSYGRDLLARITNGGRVSLAVGLVTACLTTVLGLSIGLLAGYFTTLDHILMRVCDGLMAIPGVLLAIGLMSALGPKAENVVVAVVIVSTPMMARIVRSRVLAIKQEAYVDAIRVQGAGTQRILLKHIAPNCLSVVLVHASYVFADAIIVEATLSFLGAGVPPPAPSWGNILFEGKTVFYEAWWMTVFPGLALVLSVVGLNFAGDGLRDLLDPKSSGRGARPNKRLRLRLRKVGSS